MEAGEPPPRGTRGLPHDVAEGTHDVAEGMRRVGRDGCPIRAGGSSRMEAATSVSTEHSAEMLAALSGFFDHVYVITLRRCADRQAFMTRELQGLPFEFFWGVDGKTLSAEELAAAQDKPAVRAVVGRDLSVGEVGASLSHRRVCEDALRRGFSRVLVLEDDARICPVTADDVRAMTEELPARWDLWYLGYAQFVDTFARRAVRRAKRMVYPLLGRHYGTRYTRGHSAHLRKAGFHNLAVAYAMTASGCEKLVRAQTPVKNTADGVLSYLCADRAWDAFISIPMVFEPNGMPTTIDGRPS